MDLQPLPPVKSDIVPWVFNFTLKYPETMLIVVKLTLGINLNGIKIKMQMLFIQENTFQNDL